MDLNSTIKRCQQGEKEAFQELLQSVEKKALRTAYLLSGSRGIAEDILQETYIKIFKEIKSIREPRTFNTWFFRILMRTGWEMTKKHSSMIPVDFASEKDIALSAATSNQHCNLEEYETRYVLQNAINKLSDNLKTVIILYYYNDMSIDEISKVLGCLKPTIKSRLFYARTVLKNNLPEYCIEVQNLELSTRKGV